MQLCYINLQAVEGYLYLTPIFSAHFGTMEVDTIEDNKSDLIINPEE